MFKVDNKRNIFHTFSSAFIVEFEQVNIDWVVSVLYNLVIKHFFS